MLQNTLIDHMLLHPLLLLPNGVRLINEIVITTCLFAIFAWSREYTAPKSGIICFPTSFDSEVFVIIVCPIIRIILFSTVDYIFWLVWHASYLPFFLRFWEETCYLIVFYAFLLTRLLKSQVQEILIFLLIFCIGLGLFLILPHLISLMFIKYHFFFQQRHLPIWVTSARSREAVAITSFFPKRLNYYNSLLNVPTILRITLLMRFLRRDLLKKIWFLQFIHQVAQWEAV